MRIEERAIKALMSMTSSVPLDALKIMLMVLAIVPTVVFAGTSGPSPIPPPPAFQIATPTLTMCRGVVNKMPITVSNPGDVQMTSLQLGLIASRNIYVIGNGTVTQATVPSNGTATLYLPVFVSQNTSSLVSLGISVNYNYYSLYSDSEVRNISFGVETCPSPLLVETSPIITSGRIENITLNLTNTGNTLLSAIALSMSLPAADAAVLTPQPIQLGSMEPGATRQINEKVFMFSTAAESFPLNVSIDMYNGTSPVQLLKTMPMLSTGIINITSSSMTLSPQSPTVGSIFSISMILTDTGTAGATAVTLTPLPPQGITSYGSGSVFVGDMSVDTQVPSTITMSSNVSMKAGSYTIPIRLSYLNSLRENLSEVINVPVTLGSSGLSANLIRSGAAGTYAVRYQNGGFPWLLVILIVIVILVVLWYANRKGVFKRLKHKGKGR